MLFAKPPCRSRKTTNLVHVPVISSNQLLNSRSGLGSGSYAKMAGRNSANANSPGGFFDRVARQMPLSLHSAITLLLSPRLISPQLLFPEKVIAFGHKSRREILEAKLPGSASTVNGGAATRKPGAQRPSLVRTTLTGTAEPYNGKGDSRHDAVIIWFRSMANCS